MADTTHAIQIAAKAERMELPAIDRRRAAIGQFPELTRAAARATGRQVGTQSGGGEELAGGGHGVGDVGFGVGVGDEAGFELRGGHVDDAVEHEVEELLETGGVGRGGGGPIGDGMEGKGLNRRPLPVDPSRLTSVPGSLQDWKMLSLEKTM